METLAGDDRLSELPDCVLTNNVLSRLTSRQAARTSVLSRRWRHLWRVVPCVDIDQRDFLASDDSIDVRAAGEDTIRASNKRVRLSVEESETFEDVGDRLLPLLDATPPPLDALRLRVSCTDFSSTGRRFTRRGLARRPVEFHLSCDNDVGNARIDDKFPDFPGPTLPRHLGAFACRLRTMRLSGMGLADDFADCLAEDFPVLEDLRLEGCIYVFSRLASQSLRNLLIDERCFHGYEYMDYDALAIAAPRIASLRIDSQPPPITVVGEMPDLVAASLTAPLAGELSLLIIRSLRHARSLDLTGFSATALLGGVADPGDFPVFGNLRTLLLHRCDVGVKCQVLMRFLRSAPILETLTLRDCSCSGGSSRSRKRKARSYEKAPDNDLDYWCSRTAYECMSLKAIELEFHEGRDIDELARALVRIAEEEPRPMESSVQKWDQKCSLKISFT
ncbi:unnamed protein product [Urochloa humidicola]